MRLFTTEDPKKIEAFYQESQWEKIIQTLGRKPLQEIDDVRLLNDLAVAYHQLRKFDEALEVCERIRAVEPFPDLLKQQSELTPRYMRYHAVMGEALYRRGELEKALAIFSNLKALGARFSDKYYYSGRIHTKMGNYRTALLEFKGMISNVPGRMRDVIRGLGELIQEAPAQAGVYEQLHKACGHKDRMEHYLSRFQKEMREAGGSLSGALKVAHLFFYEGEKDKGRKILGGIRPQSEEEKGWLELIRGDWVLADGGAEAALRHYGAAEPLLRPGDSHLIERLEDLVRTHKMGGLRKKLAGLYEAAGNLDGAIRHLEGEVTADPGDTEARAALERILRSAMTEAFAAGELEQAQAMGRRLLKVRPEDTNLAGQLAQIEQTARLKRKEELEGLIAAGRLPSSEKARAHFELAEIERAFGGGEDVILSHLQGAANERSPVRAQALWQMAQIHLQRGEMDTAETVHEILLGLRIGAEDRLSYGFEIAEAYEAKGEKALAKQYYERVATEDVTYRDAAGRAGRLARELEAVPAPAAPAAPTAPTDPMEFLSRRYDQIAELGRGAMGVVYKARDKILDRPVAIKMILGDLGKDPEALGRFITEAQSAAALEHPGIITIYDIHTEEPMFIVMEFVEGKSVGDLLAGKKLALSQFLPLSIRVCEPLAFAHRAKVIHRDIKPDNIMVTKTGGVKIADFGLSRKGEGSGMTQVGQVMGTPFYMAPEQIRGTGVDGRSDLYSLGITFYELLTGSVPFKEGDIAYLHMHEEPPRIGACNPEVSKQLEDVILKCLRKDPDERFQSVDELIEALRATSA